MIHKYQVLLLQLAIRLETKILQDILKPIMTQSEPIILWDSKGIVNLILLSDIECTIRRRSTGFLESIKFGEDLITINSNINVNIDTILNNRIITQNDNSSIQQGKGTIRFTVIDYGDSVQANEIDIDITIKFFVNRTDAQYKTFVESGQSI